MDLLSFLVGVIDALAWPAVVVSGILLLRREIRELLPGLSKLRVRDVEFEFGQRVEELKREFDEVEPAVLAPPAPAAVEGQGEGTLPALRGSGEGRVIARDEGDLVYRLAPISPRAAVTESWRTVEHALMELAQRVRLDERQSLGGVIKELSSSGHLPRATVEILNRLRTLRNEAVHRREMELTVQEALEYADLARQVSLRLKQGDPLASDEKP